MTRNELIIWHKKQAEISSRYGQHSLAKKHGETANFLCNDYFEICRLKNEPIPHGSYVEFDIIELRRKEWENQNKTKQNIPKKFIEIQGPPITEQVFQMFSPWGVPTGLAISLNGGIVVDFEGDYQIYFMPVSSRKT